MEDDTFNTGEVAHGSDNGEELKEVKEDA